MKEVLVYTNCQGDEIKKYLERSASFNLEYRITSVFKPHLYNDPELERGGIIQTKSLPSELLSNLRTADVFINQPFSLRRGIFSTDGENSITRYLKSDCKIITFPSLYADIFPVYKEGKYTKGLKNIEDLLLSGNTKDEILQIFKNGLVNFHLGDRLNFSLDFMIKKEAWCNIKASDFIRDNIKKHRLFDTQNHPTEILMSFIANEIFERIGIDFRLDVFNMERHLINGIGFPDSFYMYNEIQLDYVDKKEIGDYYLSIVMQYLENPENFILLDKNKTCYQ